MAALLRARSANSSNDDSGVCPIPLSATPASNDETEDKAEHDDTTHTSEREQTGWLRANNLVQHREGSNEIRRKSIGREFGFAAWLACSPTTMSLVTPLLRMQCGSSMDLKKDTSSGALYEEAEGRRAPVHANSHFSWLRLDQISRVCLRPCLVDFPRIWWVGSRRLGAS